MINNDKLNEIIEDYSDNHKKYGYGVRSLNMPSDRRYIRYYELIKNYTFFKCDESFSIIDLGCGYGDLVDYLDFLKCDYNYLGIDLCTSFIEYAKEKYLNRKNVSFKISDFFEENFCDCDFDYAVTSQTFNNRFFDDDNNIDLIKHVISNVFKKCRKGVSFNFVTDRVQYKKDNVAYHSTEELVSFSYSLSNCIVLDNSCMPYEATITILKDNAENGLIWDSFYDKHVDEFKDGIFVINNK